MPSWMTWNQTMIFDEEILVSRRRNDHFYNNTWTVIGPAGLYVFASCQNGQKFKYFTHLKSSASYGIPLRVLTIISIHFHCEVVTNISISPAKYTKLRRGFLAHRPFLSSATSTCLNNTPRLKAPILENCFRKRTVLSCTFRRCNWLGRPIFKDTVSPRKSTLAGALTELRVTKWRRCSTRCPWYSS